METLLTYSETIDSLQKFPVGHKIRIDKKIAKQLLMENRNVHSQGRVHYLGLRDIGLGLCEVWKEELENLRETKMFPRKK